MKYQRLGNSGLIVSQFAWGAANIGTPLPQFAVAPHLDEATTLKAAQIALDRGVNFFDTADLYSNGEAEEILGRALASRRREVVISTKVGMRTTASLLQSGLSRRHILDSVDGSLRRLGTDWIDVYIAHRVDPHTPLEETLEALDQTVRAGKVRYLGYSNWPAWMAAKAVEIQEKNGWARFVTAQMYYSLIGREIEYDTIPFCLDAGIGLMVWSPLAGGYLSGKYGPDDPTGGGGRLARSSFVPIIADKAEPVLAALRAIAGKYHQSPAAIAMAWLFDRPAVSTVLLGISRVELMSPNLAAADITLAAEDRKLLGEVSRIPEPYPEWFNTMLTDTIARDALHR
jgi:aryl-alcohol dehydrogenase-like predicted oxidoreductase